jgi:glutathione synthase/RimK-type ligase-like ATP-grasp enzyme
MTRLAWVTAGVARGTDPDEIPAVAALRQAGVDVVVIDWDDSSIDWSSFDRVVLRSPWDYQERLVEFISWLTEVERVTDLRNPLAPIGWSIDKHYLADLADDGVPITPTRFVEPGESARFEGPAWIVKPSIGAGSRDVVMFRAGDEAESAAHVARLHARGVAALVQPTLSSVARDGEWPMVFFDGRFSHSANKRVRLAGTEGLDELFARETNVPHTATPEQIAVAEQAMAAVERRFGTLTYARIDLVRDDAGGYCVLEVELVEPSLMLPEGGAGAIERLTRALLA